MRIEPICGWHQGVSPDGRTKKVYSLSGETVLQNAHMLAKHGVMRLRLSSTLRGRRALAPARCARFSRERAPQCVILGPQRLRLAHER